VRSKPSKNGEKVGVLELSETAELIGAMPKPMKWYRVRLSDGRQGFLYSGAVEVTS